MSGKFSEVNEMEKVEQAKNKSEKNKHPGR